MPKRQPEDLRSGRGERFIIDNSVWRRLRQPGVRASLDRLMSRRSPWAFLICPPVAAEVGFGARNAGDHAAVRSSLATFPDCERHPTTAEVLEIQTSLIDAGLFRAVGALDTVIAAYALVNEATVLHYDRDFEHVATVTPDFAQRWIAPPGTLDR